MCTFHSFLLFIYIFSVYLFGIFLRFVIFQDYFECYACKELNAGKGDFDYIIVGAGAAGSLLAERLTENKKLKILLLEAGSSGNSLLEIPTVNLMLQQSGFDWQYKTVKQKEACLGLEGKASLWPRGKGLGGTAMLNYMIYVRGHQEDFARWYQHSCNYDYSVDILPYFEKWESGAKEFLSDLRFKSNLTDYFLQAGLCLGFDLSDGINAQPGFSTPKLMMKEGRRWTTYSQLASLKRKNLVVQTNSLVEKVIFQNDTAVGVKYLHLDEPVVVGANKGVILSAGVIGTPQILMLSGIGPKRHLKQMQIKVKVDLPVGSNLQDHVTTGADLVVLDHPADFRLGRLLRPFTFIDYFLRGEGPLTSSGCETLAFFNSAGSTAPELQLMMLPFGISIDSGAHLRRLHGIGDALYAKYFANSSLPTFSVLPVVLHPKSRGTVRLKGRNPRTPPLIDPGYLTHPDDVDMLIRGVEMIKALLETAPMRKIGARINPKKFPGCEKHQFDTRAYWECYVRHFTLTVYHPVGTCAMGDVVEYDFRVKDTEKLYVVDGSVLPDLPSGNPQGAILMMTEKAADVIQYQCWKARKQCCAEEVLTGQCKC